MTDNNVTWVKVWHPTGIQLSIPVPTDGSIIDPAIPHAIFESVARILDAGFSVTMDGGEPGEMVETISHVLCKSTSDGTPLINLYPADRVLKRRLLGVYLNTPEQRAEFEQATGIKVDSMPVYDGGDHPERDDNRTAKYFVALSQPVEVVYKQNPEYVPNSTDEKTRKKPKLLFVRWRASAPRAVDTQTGEISEPVRERDDSNDATPRGSRIPVVVHTLVNSFHDGSTEPRHDKKDWSYNALADTLDGSAVNIEVKLMWRVHRSMLQDAGVIADWWGTELAPTFTDDNQTIDPAPVRINPPLFATLQDGRIVAVEADVIPIATAVTRRHSANGKLYWTFTTDVAGEFGTTDEKIARLAGVDVKKMKDDQPVPLTRSVALTEYEYVRNQDGKPYYRVTTVYSYGNFAGGEA